jgi:ABC-type nitrate/sulfonate/bicarbonate transport system permease component
VLEFFRATPPPALILVLVMLAGFGDTMKVAVIVTGAIWPILLNTVEGIKGADMVLDETCRTYQIGMSRLWNFVLRARVRRSSSACGWACHRHHPDAVTEMFAATTGLGAAIIVFSAVSRSRRCGAAC